MIPLPDKVYLPAETAEAIAWNALDDYAKSWPAIKQKFAGRIDGSEKLGDEIEKLAQANEVIARTYLTFGWRYRHRALRNNHPNALRRIVRQLETPRFVYVTEFAAVADMTGKTQYQRRIFSHCVIDATAKNQDIDSVLLFHAPGYCVWHTHDDRHKFQRLTAAIDDDTLYFPKVRGEIDFTKFASP